MFRFDPRANSLFQFVLLWYLDHGVVLTEDTDKFIIGQHVWVGGHRPGQIAFIGETHFAPGDWAGVVLDDASGKNDGCVSGKRYFQCEPKRGIFSRLTRLTLEPLSSVAGSPTESMTTSQRSIVSPARSSSGSPTHSVRSYAGKSPSSQCLKPQIVGSRNYFWFDWISLEMQKVAFPLTIVWLFRLEWAVVLEFCVIWAKRSLRLAIGAAFNSTNQLERTTELLTVFSMLFECFNDWLTHLTVFPFHFSFADISLVRRITVYLFH